MRSLEFTAESHIRIVADSATEEETARSTPGDFSRHAFPIGESIVASLEKPGQPFVIDSQLVLDRGV